MDQDRAADHRQTGDWRSRDRGFDAAIANTPDRAEQICRVAVQVWLAHLEYARHRAQRRPKLIADAGVGLAGDVGGQGLATVRGIFGRDARGFEAARVAAIYDERFGRIDGCGDIVKPRAAGGFGQHRAAAKGHQAAGVVRLLEAGAELADA